MLGGKEVDLSGLGKAVQGGETQGNSTATVHEWS
jgi:hypothetical protein